MDNPFIPIHLKLTEITNFLKALYIEQIDPAENNEVKKAAKKLFGKEALKDLKRPPLKRKTESQLTSKV